MKKFAMIFLALQPLFANFTVNLGQKIETSPKNWIFSPLSISTCLEMVMEGTANETLDEMKSVLGSKKSVSFSKYLPQTPTDFELNLTEGVFLRNGFSILKSYETVLKTSFDALIASVPFNRETARYINKWVEGQTHQKIQNLIQESDLSYASQMVLINCLYFQGNWAFPFLNQNTHEDLFFSTPVNTVKTLFMEQFHELSYAETDRYQAVLLPFVSKNKTCHPACLLFLPKENESFFTESIEEILPSLEPRSVHLFVPKFKMEYRIDLTDPLKQLGMRKVFTPLADLSNIAGTRDLFLSAVLHKAYIAFEEKGVEAAAATGAIISRTSILPSPPVLCKMNRPFYFAIFDLDTKIIFFVGYLKIPCF